MAPNLEGSKEEGIIEDSNDGRENRFSRWGIANPEEEGAKNTSQAWKGRRWSNHR